MSAGGGSVVGAALVAHVPTIVLPEAVRYELNEGREISLVPGLHRMKSERLDRLSFDTIIVFDAHWFTTVEFVVAAHAAAIRAVHLRGAASRDVADALRHPGRSGSRPADGRRGDGRRLVDDRDRRSPSADPLPDDQPAAVLAGRRALGERQPGPDGRDRRLPAGGRGDRSSDRAQRTPGRAAGQRRHEPHVLEAEGAPRPRVVGPTPRAHPRGSGRRSRTAGVVRERGTTLG